VLVVALIDIVLNCKMFTHLCIFVNSFLDVFVRIDLKSYLKMTGRNEINAWDVHCQWLYLGDGNCIE
jgi:hypothetical protein